MKKLSNLSKLMLLLILLFCSATQSIAQFRRNHLKINLTNMMISSSEIGRYEMGYEYRLNKNWSLEGSLGLIRAKGIVPYERTTVGTFQYEDVVGVSILFIPILFLERPYYEERVRHYGKKDGGFLTLGGRWYARSSINKPQQGFYIGANLLFSTYRFDHYRNVFRSDAAIWGPFNTTQKVTETVTYQRLQQNAFGGKLDVGWQWTIKKKVALDVYLGFGAQYRTYPLQESLIYNNPIVDLGLKMGILWD